MSLAQKVESTLNGLTCPQVNPIHLDETEQGQRFECDLAALDVIGCAFERFALQSDKLQSAEIDVLRDVADDLSKRLTYLLEPIQAIEVDSQQCTVQMRSVPPSKTDDRTSYYELLVRKGGELILRRWAADYGSGRQVILAQVTREVFLRLVRDFSAAAA
ncbi:MAG TPA: hypothetical protein VHV77_10285 [Pirellulales bacterium]|jgi:hypothetical protein|nr:hypothetical protein [Pirellulales bacterium]